jgi:hypothetical protein
MLNLFVDAQENRINVRNVRRNNKTIENTVDLKKKEVNYQP